MHVYFCECGCRFHRFTAGNGAGIFAINSCSGQITVVLPVLDYEAQSGFVLEVTVTDSGVPTLTAFANVNVSILDVNEARA